MKKLLLNLLIASILMGLTLGAMYIVGLVVNFCEHNTIGAIALGFVGGYSLFKMIANSK